MEMAKAQNTRKRTPRATKGAVRRHARRGASPLLQGVAKALRLLLRGALAAAILLGIGGAGYFGKQFIDQASQRPIGSIGVEGPFVYISQEEVSALVTPMIKEGFLQAPLSAIKAELESNPWVAEAAVSRRWPDQLYIAIVEEQPIARWGKAGFLNHKGEVIEVKANARLAGFPLLSGNPGQAKAVMQNYQQLAQLLRPHGLKVSEFYSDELFSWNVVLSGGLKLTIGRDHAMEKVQRFLLVYQRDLHRRLDEVAAVDLRYGNGLAVQWKRATAESADEEKTDKKA